MPEKKRDPSMRYLLQESLRRKLNGAFFFTYPRPLNLPTHKGSLFIWRGNTLREENFTDDQNDFFLREFNFVVHRISKENFRKF